MRIQLRKPVVVTEIVDGVAQQLTGIVVGVSCEQEPHYDVLVNGKVLSNLEACQVREPSRRQDIFGVVK